MQWILICVMAKVVDQKLTGHLTSILNYFVHNFMEKVMIAQNYDKVAQNMPVDMSETIIFY